MPAPIVRGEKPASVRDLPAVGAAFPTLMRPSPRHRWHASTGLVETLDGSLLLHGAIRARRPGRLEVVVLADYQPVAAQIRILSGGRQKLISKSDDGRLRFDAPPGVSFDIELPRETVAVGHWREIQTYVAMADEPPDVRRWTLHAGPVGPRTRACEVATETGNLEGRRSRLDPAGRFRAVAPQPGDIAAVALSGKAIAPARYIRFGAKDAGFETSFTPSPDVVAVWPSPLSGPGPDWISNFWTTRAVSGDREGVPRDVVR